MATVESNFFEIQRRAYEWSRFSTLDDGVTAMEWDNDPNLAVKYRTPGETKLVAMPIGAFYVRSDGTLYFKQAMPNNWVVISQGSTAPLPTGGNTFITYDFTNALEWIVQHNQNTTIFNEVLYDTAGNKFYAPVKIIDANSFKVNLTEASSGRVSVMFPA